MGRVNRRKFILGVGAFAAGLFIPKSPKIFVMGGKREVVGVQPIQLPPRPQDVQDFLDAMEYEMRAIACDLRLNVRIMSDPKWKPSTAESVRATSRQLHPPRSSQRSVRLVEQRNEKPGEKSIAVAVSSSELARLPLLSSFRKDPSSSS